MTAEFGWGLRLLRTTEKRFCEQMQCPLTLPDNPQVGSEGRQESLRCKHFA